MGKYQLALETARRRAVLQSVSPRWVKTLEPVVLASHVLLVTTYEQLGESDKATPHCVAIGKPILERCNATRAAVPTDPEYPPKRGREGPRRSNSRSTRRVLATPAG
jgi:hypothetical protein